MVDKLIGAKAENEVFFGSRARSCHVGTQMPGDLHCIMAYAPASAVDQYFFSGFCFSIGNQRLPGCQCGERGCCGFLVRYVAWL
ncbi:hypothetical protein D3C87_2039130 [compost metagenome]